MPQPRVELEIAQGADAWGKVVIELDQDKAPITVANFLKYVESSFYDGTIFHRVVANFMIQGGGYTAPGAPKQKGIHEPIQNEAANGLKNLKYTIAMARTNDAHSATSQFFINLSDNAFLNHPGHDDWGYCVFGKVVEGFELVDRLKAVPTVDNPDMGENSLPKIPPMIKAARKLPG